MKQTEHTKRTHRHGSKNVEEWRETTARKAKEKTSERRKTFLTSSHIVVPDLATQEDLRDFDPQSQLGYPGEYPYTRGIHPGMYRSRLGDRKAHV